MTSEFRRRLGAKRAEVSHIISHEMRVRGYSGAALARALGCSGANVSRTINGSVHSPLVLDALRELGVPERYLFDPRLAELPTVSKPQKEKAVA